jgi:hypothetical protein
VDEGRIVEWVNSPISSHLHYPKGLRDPPPILTGSWHVAPYFSICGKKMSCEKPERKHDHEGLEESPIPGPQGRFPDFSPGQGTRGMKKDVQENGLVPF